MADSESSNDNSNARGVYVLAEEHATRYGQHEDMVFHRGWDRSKPKGVADLFNKPIIRQWIDGGRLYREPISREVPHFEVFFDLLFVGIIHQLAEGATEPAGGLSVARFVLTFYPSWSIWEEARRYSNVSGTDDMLHRLWVLIGMVCLVGYSVNASAIKLHPDDPDVALSGISAYAAQKVQTVFGGGDSDTVFAAVGSDVNSVHAAIGFWLVVKATRVLMLFYYAYRLPEFRPAQLMSGIAVLVPMCVYMPLLWVTSRSAQIAIATAAICVDLVRLDVVLFYLDSKWRDWKQYHHEQKAIRSGELDPSDAKVKHFSWMRMGRLPKGFLIPAINIEHSIERSSAFLVLVTGELVSNLLYVAVTGEFGISKKFEKAVMGLMVAWALNYLYLIPQDDSNDYEHALRRSWLTGVLFVFFHWPMCAALVLASAASKMLLENNNVKAPLKWYWCCGLGGALIFMASIDMLHRDLKPWYASRIPRAIRFGVALLAAVGLILSPLLELHSRNMMGLAVAILWSVLAMYIYGILPSKRWLDETGGDPTEPRPDPVVVDMHEGHNHNDDQGALEDVEERLGVMANT